MATIFSDTRELKSLKLFNKTKKLELFFLEKNQCGLIISCPGLTSEERINMQEQFLENNLRITKISNKLVQFLCKEKSMLFFNHLLSGSLFLIESNSENKDFLLNELQLSTILKYKTFTFRLLLWNQQLYRSKDVLQIVLKDKDIPGKKLLILLNLLNLNFYTYFHMLLKNNNANMLNLVKNK